MNEYPEALKEFEKLLKRNRIFMERTTGVGAITAERALSYSFSGPNLRATGIDYDVRVMEPYSSYDDFEFDVPVGKNGDTYRSEEHTSELQSRENLVCRLLL